MMPHHHGRIADGSPWIITRSGFPAKSAHKIDDQAYQQNQAKPASTNGRPANVKSAAAEQEKKNKDEKDKIHGCKIALRGAPCYGAFPH
jgi:hypothetical protein